MRSRPFEGGRQLIIFQQGAHKTASSFCAQLLRAICEQNGHAQGPGHALVGDPKMNGYVPEYRKGEVDFDALPPFTVLKSHANPGAARECLLAGKGMGFVTFRDPLDCVQSLMDHARADSGEFAKEFNWLKTPVEAANLHLLHLSYSMLWMRLPNVHAVRYDDLRERPGEVVTSMAAKLGLPVDVETLLAKLGKVRRLNVGVAGRGKALLDGPDGDEVGRMLEPVRWRA